MFFKDLALYFSQLEKTSSRLEITKILSDLLGESEINEVDKVVYLSLGMLAPSYDGLVINLADKMVIRSLSLAFGSDASNVTKLFKENGDLGEVARILSEVKKTHKIQDKTVGDVYNILLEIANDSGEGSQERKVSKMAELVSSLDPVSAKYITRIPLGRLRLGFSEKTIIDALAKGDKSVSAKVEQAYNIRPDIGYIARLVKKNILDQVKPELGVPIVPMLAQRLNSTSEMVNKMKEVAVEPKYDGLRIFIHFVRNPKPGQSKIKTFTRNMNSIPLDTFPELNQLGDYLNADSVILDTEAVGIDPKREMFLDFQKTIQRRRKHNVKETSVDIPLQFQAFDILLVDGESLIDKTYLERRKVLEKVVKSGALIRVDESTLTTDPEVIKKKHLEYLSKGLEGVVVKKSRGSYVSGRTGWNWVKMKEEEGKSGRLSDTVDCVILGFTKGKGKRVGFGVGQFLAGIKTGDSYLTITKVGTGLSDEQFKELNSRLVKIISKTKPKEYLVHKDLEPDTWVLPQVVVELAADEITKSPKHTSGYALRFPRLIKFRDDKNSDQTTTLEEINEIRS